MRQPWPSFEKYMAAFLRWFDRFFKMVYRLLKMGRPSFENGSLKMSTTAVIGGPTLTQKSWICNLRLMLKLQQFLRERSHAIYDLSKVTHLIQEQKFPIGFLKSES